MTKSFPLLIAVVCLAVACNEKQPETIATPAPFDPAAVVSPTPVDVAPGATAVNDPNPAHGEPGHRCDIAVGASLSTPVTAGSAEAPAAFTPMDPAPAMQTMPTTPSAGGGRLNPAHGEPGHDCAVAVGAPLPN